MNIYSPKWTIFCLNYLISGGKLEHNFASLIPIDTIFVPKCVAPLGLFQIKCTCRYLSNKLCQIAVIWDFGFNSRKRGTRDQQ